MKKFIKEFLTEAAAKTFARSHNGIIVTRYDYDNIHNKVLKFYIVKY